MHIILSYLIVYFLSFLIIGLSYYTIYKLVLPKSKIFKWLFEEPKDKKRKKRNKINGFAG